MKKTSKPNPLKTFNDNKANAIKKADGVMSSYKKALGGVAEDPTKKEIRQGMRAINKADRQDKRWNRRDERIQARKQ